MIEDKKEPEKPVKTEPKVPKPAPEELIDLATLGQKIQRWELAGLMHFARWKPGKSVTEKEFDDNLALFRKRPQGGGRIKK
jgi:hypothetical protein